MATWKPKSCPRCSGDMFLEDGYKWYEHCLQCGYTHEMRSLFENVPRKEVKDENHQSVRAELMLSGSENRR